MLELLSFIEDCCIGVPRVADRRDPMRQKEQAVQLPVNGCVMHMHIDQAREHVGTRKTIASLGGGAVGARCGDRNNLSALRREGLASLSGAAWVDHSHVGEHKLLLVRDLRRCGKLENKPPPTHKQAEPSYDAGKNLEKAPYYHDPSLLTRATASWQEEQRAQIGHSPFAAPTPAWRAIRQQHRPLRNPDLGLAY